MKTSLDMTSGLVDGPTGLPRRLLLVLAMALLTACGGGEDDTDAQRGTTLPVDCRTAPLDCT